MLGFRILFAREEHKRIRQCMVGTRQLLRDRGYYVEGLPPFGYCFRGCRPLRGCCPPPPVRPVPFGSPGPAIVYYTAPPRLPGAPLSPFAIRTH